MNFDLSWVSILTGAFGTALLKLLWDVIQYFINRYDKTAITQREFDKRQQKLDELFNDLISGAVKIQELVEEFAINHDVSRLLLMKLENGGGIPQLGTAQHVSVLNEHILPELRDLDEPIEPIKHQIQNYTVDAGYQKVLLMAMTSPDKMLKTEDLEYGFLKTMYSGVGIQKFIIYPITHIPSIEDAGLKGFMIYISIEFTDDREWNPRIQMDMTFLKEQIKNIYTDFYVKRLATMA